jgi:hypothetical protein
MDPELVKARKLARAEKLAKEIEIDEACAADPLVWLTGHTRTRDDHWLEKGTSPFAPLPHKPYMDFLFWRLRNGGQILVAKSRDLLVTWAVMGYCVWEAQFHGPADIIVQCQTELKVVDLVGGRERLGYCATLYQQQDDLLKYMHPLTKPLAEFASDLLAWENGSTIRGVPSGADVVRQWHPRIYVVDEAGFVDGFEGSWGAALPVATKLIAVSSASASVFGDWCQELLEMP